MTRSTRPAAAPSRFTAALVLLGIAVAVSAAVGTPVRATRGGQVTADEPQYLLSAISLAEDGNLDIADELADERWRDFHEAELPQQTKPLPGGRQVSPHDPLLPLLLAVPVALGGWVGAKLALSVVAGMVAVLTAWLAVRRFGVPPGVAVPLVAVFSVSVPLAAYGTQIYPEIVAALAVLAAVVALRGPLGARGLVLLTVAVAALPWLAIKYAPVAATLAAVAVVMLVRGGRWRAAVTLVGVLSGLAVIYAAVHLAIYGGVTPYAAGDHFVGGELTVVGSDPSYLGRARRLVGLLIDRHFGIAAWQPAWLLTVPALAVVIRLRPPGWATLIAPVAAGWLTATFVALTMQGWWFPGRQIVVVLPLAVIAITVAAARLRALRIAALALAALGIWSYAWLVAAGLAGDINWVVTFFDVADPWYRTWSALLPNYLDVSLGTWVRQGLWLVALAAGALLVGRTLRGASRGPAAAGGAAAGAGAAAADR